MTERVEKLWGHEEILVNTELYCAKHLIVEPGFQCSFHYHRIKDETFLVLDGTISLEVQKKGEDKIENYILQRDDFMRIYPGDIHRFSSLGDTAIILEVSTHDDNEDSYRLENSRKIY